MLWSHEPAMDTDNLRPSPLLATVLEQLEIKSQKGLISHQHCLYVMSFVRRLSLRFTTKTLKLQPLFALSQRLSKLAETFGHTGISAALTHEITILESALSTLHQPFSPTRQNHHDKVHGNAHLVFLKVVRTA